MPVLSILLGEYSCHYSIRGIHFQSSLQFRLIMIEYRGIHQSSLQFFKGFLALIIPHKRYFSFSQLVQWLCYSAVVLDESSIEIAESKKRLDSSYCVGNLPVMNHLYLFQVNLNAFCCQDESQVLSSGDVEFTLLDAHLQSCSTESFQYHLHIFLMLCFIL